MRTIESAVDLLVERTQGLQGVLPPQPPVRLVVLYGPPCTGKTSVGRLLARNLSAYRLPMENASSALRELGEIATDAMSKDIFRVMEGAVIKLLSAGSSLICEGAFADTRRRIALSSCADRFGAKCMIIRLTAPRELLRQRLVTRQLAGLDSEGFAGETISCVKLDWFIELYDKPFYYALPSEIVIDTEANDVDLIVSRITQAIAGPCTSITCERKY
jgi:predicted kinase